MYCMLLSRSAFLHGVKAIPKGEFTVAFGHAYHYKISAKLRSAYHRLSNPSRTPLARERLDASHGA